MSTGIPLIDSISNIFFMIIAVVVAIYIVLTPFVKVLGLRINIARISKYAVLGTIVVGVLAFLKEHIVAILIIGIVAFGLYGLIKISKNILKDKKDSVFLEKLNKKKRR